MSKVKNQTLDTNMIYYNNESRIKLSKSPMFQDRSKHIKIKYHSIKDRVQKGAMALRCISTNQQVAKILTKPQAKG